MGYIFQNGGMRTYECLEFANSDTPRAFQNAHLWVVSPNSCAWLPSLAVNLRPLGLLVFGDLKSVNRNQNAGFEKLIYNQATQFKEQSDWQKMLFLLQAPLCKSALLTFLERETPKCTCKLNWTAYMKKGAVMKCESILSTAPFECAILYFISLQSKKEHNAPSP